MGKRVKFAKKVTTKHVKFAQKVTIFEDGYIIEGPTNFGKVCLFTNF